MDKIIKTYSMSNLTDETDDKDVVIPKLDILKQ